MSACWSGRALRRYRLDALPRWPDKLRVLVAVSIGLIGALRGRCSPRLPLVLVIGAVLSLGARPAAAESPSALPPPSSASAPVPRAAQETSASVSLLAFVFGAIGLSGISVAGTTGFLALNQKAIAEDHCSPTVQLCDGRGRDANEEGRTLRDISTASLIVGGLGLGLSAYFLLTAPTPKANLAVAVVVDGAQPRAALVAHF